MKVKRKKQPAPTPANAAGHFKTVVRHKYLVAQGCFAVGLYRQGILHDLSNHHKGRNRHHYEYWVDYNLRGEIDGQVLIPVKMPGRYVVEMLMDRIAASKVYKGDDYTDASALEYYRGGRPELLMHPETAALLEKLLTMLAEKGEKETFAYVRAHLRKGGLFDR